MRILARPSRVVSGLLGLVVGVAGSTLIHGLLLPRPSNEMHQSRLPSAKPGRRITSVDSRPKSEEGVAPRIVPANQLADKRTEGYVLESDIPEFRRRLDESAEVRVRMMMDRCNAEYRKLLADLGVSDEQSTEVRQHIREVLKAKLIAAQASTVFAHAREALDNRMQRLLDGKYSRFREYEEKTPVRIEFEEFEQYVSRKAVTLSDAEKSDVRDLILAARAFSDVSARTYFGAYSDPPAVATGAFAIPLLEARISEVQASSKALLSAAESAGIRAEVVNTLSAYYEYQISAVENVLDAMRNPVANRIATLTEQLEILRRKPIENRERISRVEADIAALRLSSGQD